MSSLLGSQVLILLATHVGSARTRWPTESGAISRQWIGTSLRSAGRSCQGAQLTFQSLPVVSQHCEGRARSSANAVPDRGVLVGNGWCDVGGVGHGEGGRERAVSNGSDLSRPSRQGQVACL